MVLARGLRHETPLHEKGEGKGWRELMEERRGDEHGFISGRRLG